MPIIPTVHRWGCFSLESSGCWSWNSEEMVLRWSFDRCILMSIRHGKGPQIIGQLCLTGLPCRLDWLTGKLLRIS